MSEIEITQEDREAAAARWNLPVGALNDSDADVQMLARHRQAARERALDEAAEVADANRHAGVVAYVIASQIRKLKEA